MSLNSAFRLSIIKRHLSQAPAPLQKPTNITQTFKYTTSAGILTPEQREQYENDGFVVIPKLISDQSLEKLDDLSYYSNYFISLLNKKPST
jgi:hypothetical protein